ncbi:YceI family protein [Catalinimonas niigatensis]|uniref:YceI family protein n=1 Tax=Catalinimonas niigatensis TaxID=1397264 RepID=UPI0026657ACB|nr:YceI family protein [Catalinimonas niigatensis]WPP48737.1 YceI family protein [Catalinimonas niigatensis]
METTQLTKTWAIDAAHSEIHFKVKHMMVSIVTGSFDEFEGSVKTENNDFEDAKITFTAKIDSINTKNVDRDNHLKSDDFFNAEEFPELKFTSKSFRKVEEDEYILTGNLTIRNITKEVELGVLYHGQAVDPYGNTKAGFEIKGKISRKDFGLSWNAITEAGSIVVADPIKLDLNIQLILN